MSEEKEEGAINVGELDRPIEERERGPPSIDVIDNQNLRGEVPLAEPQEEKPQEEHKEMEQAPEESRISRRKQKRRITSYLSNIPKQVEKQGNQINKLTIMIQSLQGQKQKQSKSITSVVALLSQSLESFRNCTNLSSTDMDHKIRRNRWS